MASRPSKFWPVATVIIAVLVVLIALPSGVKAGWPSFLNPGFHLGLDLAGGTQLDFRISESELQTQLASINQQIDQINQQGGAGGQDLVELTNERTVIQQQQQNIVEAIRTVLERRINALGVSEATITPSYVGGEKHLLVECPGVVDVQKCIATVGKTIQLEFKEEFTQATPDYEKSVRQNVANAVKRMKESGATLSVLGQDVGGQLGMGYEDSHVYFQDQLPKGLESIWNATASSTVIQKDGSVAAQSTDSKGNPTTQEVPGVFLVQVLKAKTMTGRVVQDAGIAFTVLAQQNTGTKESTQTNVQVNTIQPTALAAALRTMKAGDLNVVPLTDGSADLVFLQNFLPGKEQVDVSHILVAYKGANTAPANVTRTKAEALARAQQLRAQLLAGADFATLARAQSDGPSAKNGGSLGLISRGDLVPSFEDVAFTEPVGQISEPVETPFGYHLIRVNKAPATSPDTASYNLLAVTGKDAEARANVMLTQLKAGDVKENADAITLRTLFFSLQPTGWKDTSLDGKHFRSATVTLDPSTNLPVVQIVFDAEGGKLFQDLTKNNIGKRIAIFVGGDLVSAPTVQGEITGGTAIITGSSSYDEASKLAQDLNTGAIPAPIYLSGQQTVEATLGAQALQTSLLAGIIGMIIIMIFMIFVYRFLGVIADAALLIYALIFIDLLKLPLFLFSSQYVVLTLAGAAGMILSIGMAVDCNVLVFERVKEELKRGKMLKTAVEVGFERAWPSIRDSNISTIITCAVLFIIGTSIVRGFAITLGLGVIISMFTGMVIARWMSRKVANSDLANRPHLFPGNKQSVTPPAVSDTH